VLNVMLPNIGMLLTKDALLANLDILGTMLLTNALVANSPELFRMVNVLAHSLKLFGTLLQRPAHVQLTLLVITVFHVQPQESGTLEPILANVHHQQTYGTEPNVSVQLEDTDHHALNALLQDSGMFHQTNVFAKSLSSGTETNVFAHNPSSHTKADAQDAQTDILGKITNARPVHALSRICKFSELENDRFIHVFHNTNESS
jgi:hypothetical protein